MLWQYHFVIKMHLASPAVLVNQMQVAFILRVQTTGFIESTKRTVWMAADSTIFSDWCCFYMIYLKIFYFRVFVFAPVFTPMKFPIMQSKI